jgi:murein DD-endopeptidase MepM/ murein hydrolase activator NlpD
MNMHKKHKKKFLNIILIPDDDSASKSLKIRFSILKLLTFLGILFVLIILFGIFSYSKILQSALKTKALEKENEQLKNQVSKVGQLNRDLDLLKNYNKRVRSSLQGYVNFAKADESIESVIQEEQNFDKAISIFTTYPLKAPVSGFISQEYKGPLHSGLDIVAAEGTPIHATADGIVLFSDWTIEEGYSIIIQHGNDFHSYYKHNQKNLVFAHQLVKQGDVIALLGNSGAKSSGPHLHFEIWKGGKAVNPMEYLTDLN